MNDRNERLRYRINDRIINNDHRRPPKTRNREWAERTLDNLEAMLNHRDLSDRLFHVVSAISSQFLIERAAVRAVELIGSSLTTTSMLVGCRRDRHQDKDFRMFSFETSDPAFEEKIRDFIMPILVPKIIEIIHSLKGRKAK